MSSYAAMLIGIIKSARPHQWIKNISLYAALVFSGLLFLNPLDGPPYFYVVSATFVIFCLLSSSVYIFNDILDYEADRAHPFKSKRPIAAGVVPRNVALVVWVFLLIVAGAGARFFSPAFQLLCAAYVILQVLYSLKLKHLPIIDLISIAAGFLIRVYAGAVVVNLHMSVWFLLTVISASLFLAVGKRQSERTLLTRAESTDIGSTRLILKRYSQRLLDQYTGMFANTTWLTYALFSFEHESARPSQAFSSRYYSQLPRTWQSEKLLMLSLPFVIFGVMRYLQLIYEDNQGESPAQVLLRDLPLLATVVLFGLVVLLTLYGLG